MKLGYIDYLNCYPFYFHMFERRPLRGVDIHPAHPSELNRMVASGDLDMSPVSAAAVADMSGRVLLLPDFCLSSIGYVQSVILTSRVPIEDLDGRTIGLTSASQTSVVLLKILLSRYYGLSPVYATGTTRPGLRDFDAALIIGNEAMLPSAEPIPYTYDLGDLWLRKTGYPVVFAVFTVRRDAAAARPAEVAAVIASYRESLECLKKERETVIRKAGEKYPDIAFDIGQYYTILQFVFTDRLKSALMFYYNTAADLGLLKRVEKLEFYEP